MNHMERRSWVAIPLAYMHVCGMCMSPRALRSCPSSSQDQCSCSSVMPTVPQTAATARQSSDGGRPPGSGSGSGSGWDKPALTARESSLTLTAGEHPLALRAADHLLA